MSIDYRSINAAIPNNDFTAFNQLNDEERAEVMKTWAEEMWCNYYTKGPMSEQEF